MDALLDPGVARCQADHLLHARLRQRQQLVMGGSALQAKEQTITDCIGWATADVALQSPPMDR